MQFTGGGGGGGGGSMSTCVPTGQCQGVGLTCSGSSNCPTGEVCCLDFGGGGGGGPPTASCQMSCGRGGGGGGGGGGRGGLQLCNSNADCPPGEQCVMTPFGLNVCRRPRGG